MAMSAGLCEKEYGQQLLDLVERAIALKPTSCLDLTQVEAIAEKARADKKNTDEDKIRMSVAKSKGQWTDFALPFADYVTALKNACK
jgi:3-dehydroquinate synthetase